MKFLTQINGTDNDKWRRLEATDSKAAAIEALRFEPNGAELLPCTVYVSIGDMKHPNGAPMVVNGYKLEKR